MKTTTLSYLITFGDLRGKVERQEEVVAEYFPNSATGAHSKIYIRIKEPYIDPEEIDVLSLETVVESLSLALDAERQELLGEFTNPQPTSDDASPPHATD